jgi:release factor glutamine methyltransferase
MNTVNDALLYVKKALQSAHIKEASRQAEDLICDLLNYSRSELFLNLHKKLSDYQLEECMRKLSLRLSGMPLQYIHGQVDFYGCSISVNPFVLIPRQETEILVDKIVQELSKKSLQNQVLWDVCCGSGCIGIALKKKFPQLNVLLSDRSENALDVAKENARINQVQVVLLAGDLLLPFSGMRADYLVCNPPYISEKEYLSLEDEVLKHEPKEALLAGKSGLEFYERLAQELPGYLSPQAKVWLEIGYQQGEALLGIFSDSIWKIAKVEKDWAGHDRFFSCEFEP